jgi:hypothetical protein
MYDRYQVGNKSNWFTNNMKNCVWLSGFIYSLSSDLKRFYIVQGNTHSRYIDMIIDIPLPNNFKEGSGVKIFGRIKSQQINNKKSLVVEALFIEYASLLDLPNNFSVNNDENNPMFHKFDELVQLPKVLGKAINTVSIAGFLDDVSFDKDENGVIKKDCLMISLRISKTDTIPVRLYGKRAVVIYNTVKSLSNKGKFFPIVFEDNQIRSKIIAEEDGNIVYNFIFTNNIKFINKTMLNQYFIEIPSWIYELKHEYEQNKQVELTT